MTNRDRFEAEYRQIITALVSERQKRGLTQWDVARAMGIDQSQLSKLERSERRLDIIDYVRYCRALGMEPGVILSHL